MGLFDSIKDAIESSKKFDEARGDEYGTLKDMAANASRVTLPPTGYAERRTIKRYRDVYEHPEEGIDATIKNTKATYEVGKVVKTIYELLG